jgi:isoquinoline 1-oxidoreductase beta subunit
MKKDRMPCTAEPNALLNDPNGLTRRGFFGMAASVLIYGFHVPLRAAGVAAPQSSFEPNAFIRIDNDGVVTLIIPQVEMGQGTYTSLSMVLVDELDADWKRVRVEHAPADEKLYSNPMLASQTTGNSNSARAFWTPLRQAGAAARACLIEAAARNWGIPASECRAENGNVIHELTGRKTDFGSLVKAAASIAPPENPALKTADTYRLIGKSLPRLDTPDKTNGKARYGIDAAPPGVKFATLAQSPVLGGTVARADDRLAKEVAGVHQVIILENLVAVVANHMWAAKKGLEAIDISWDDGQNSEVSSGMIW